MESAPKADTAAAGHASGGSSFSGFVWFSFGGSFHNFDFGGGEGVKVIDYLGNIAVVQRKDLAEAVAEFCKARAALAVAAPGKRPGLNSVYVADTARQLTEFAKTFTGTAVADLGKTHIDAYIGSHTKISPKSRNHLRSTIRMFLGWCVRRDYLAASHRLLEADGLRKEPLDNAPIDFYRPSELRSLLEKSSCSMRAVIALQALGVIVRVGGGIARI